MAICHIRVQAEPFDVGAETQALVAGKTDIGAVVTFTGLCRSENGRLSALELEHYPGMAEEELGRVADEAAQKWTVDGLTIIHRFGVIKPGEPIVLVIATSAHRQAAFEAADFLMDYLKMRAPFWKKEHNIDQKLGKWVDAKHSDEAVTERWIDR